MLGLAFGSFVNALVFRLSEQSKHAKSNKKKVKDAENLSVLKGRSMCPHCRHELAWYDLLPIVSWLSLKGKCRYCGHKIEDSPLVELVTAILFVASYFFWPYGFGAGDTILFGTWLIVLTGLIALAIYDIKWTLLPNRLAYPLLAFWTSVLVVLTVIEADFGILVTAFWGLIFCGGIFWLLFQVSNGRWIGGGDVKLGFLLGILVGGPFNALMLIFIASLLGTAVALPLMIKGNVRVTSRIPFGPFLIAAGIIVFLFNESIVNWYKVTFLIF